MIVGIVVRLPMLDRPVCLPVTARLVRTDTTAASRPWLARQAVDSLATALPGRRLHVVADAAYAGRQPCGLPARLTWTTRLREDAALLAPTPPRTGKPGRPRKKGNRLPSLAQLAATATCTPTDVHRYGRTSTIHTATTSCPWYAVFGTQPVTVGLVRERATARGGHHTAWVTTDVAATAAQTVERYAARWSVEVAIEEAKQLFGVGQAHNRTARAVARTVPFGLACQTLTVVWYATAGHHPDDITGHRARPPWYRTKRQPSTADMLVKIRRVLITTRFRPTQPEQPTQAELDTIRLAWNIAAA